MRGPKPDRQRQLRPVHHRPGRYRRLATAVEAFVGVHPAPQERRASGTTGRTDKPLRPTPLEQERRTARLVRKVRLKLSQRSRPRHPVPPRARRRSPAHGTLILLLTNLGQRDEPCEFDKVQLEYSTASETGGKEINVARYAPALERGPADHKLDFFTIVEHEIEHALGFYPGL